MGGRREKQASCLASDFMGKGQQECPLTEKPRGSRRPPPPPQSDCPSPSLLCVLPPRRILGSEAGAWVQ